MKSFDQSLSIAAFLTLLAVPSSLGQLTFVSGEISGNETWSGVVSVTGDVTVTPTGKLIITPGTRIEADLRVDDQIGGAAPNRVELIVKGALDAQGTADSPIVFTVFAGNPPGPVAAGDWYGLRLQSDQVALRYCTVEYAVTGISIEAGNPILDHCVVQNGGTGISIAAGNPTLERCVVQKNNTDGISIANGLQVTLSQCDIVDNGSYGITQPESGGLTLTKCNVLRNQRGLNGGQNLSLLATDSMISSNRDIGLVGGNLTATLERCRVEHNAAQGIYANGNMALTGAVCSVSYNGGNGINHRAFNTMVVMLTGCQIVGNGEAGVDALGQSVQLLVTGSVIASNRVGVLVQTQGAKVEGLSGNQLFANTEYEIRNNGPGVVFATNNVLGEPTPTELQAGKLKLTKIYDSQWDPSVGQVIIDRPPPGGGTVVEGEISGNATWSGNISILGDVTVTGTGKLTIAAGTRIECTPRADSQVGGAAPNRAELIVKGTLDAQGTADSPIVFTVFAGNPPVTAGDWYGLRLQSDQVALRYCTMEYAVTGISIEAGNPILDHCVVQNGGTGISIAAGNPTLERCVVQKNNTDGISIANGLQVTLSQCDIVDNGSYGITQPESGGLTLTKCNVLRNQRGLNGGQNLSLLATDSMISSNRDIGLVGGNLTATLERCRVEHNAAQGIYANGNMALTGAVCSVSYNGGNGINHRAFNTMVVMLTGCQIVGNGEAGVDALGQSVQLLVTGSVIASNRVGVLVQTQGAKVEGLSGNDLYGNTEFELRNNGPGPVTVTNNFWGEPTTTELANRITNLKKIYDSRDDANVGQVIIRPSSEQCFVCESAPSIGVQPQSQVAAPGQDVIFTVSATGTPPLLSYQWLKDGGPIPNATAATLIVTNVSASDTGKYRVVVSNSAGSTPSIEVDLILNTDTQPPSVFHTIGLNGTSVALVFSELLRATSATNKANYNAGPAQSVAEASLDPDQKTVFLSLAGSAPSDLQVNYSNISDIAGNAASGTAKIVNLTGVDIGAPAQAGSAQLVANAGIEALGGGSDVGGASDNFYYQYLTVSGDFDIQVRVADLDNTDQWAKAGISIREATTPGSRHYGNLVTPAPPGKNVNFVQFRSVEGAEALFPDEFWRPCNYPNNWLRVQRTGAIFSSFASTDGANWVQFHQLTETNNPYPNAVFVGLATTAHADATRAKATYLNFSLQMAPSGPSLEITKSDINVTISWPATYTGFVLQSTANLSSSWTDITTGITSVGDKLSKTVDITNGPEFYRLKK